MNHIGKLAGGIALAIGMAVAGSGVAAPVASAGMSSEESLRFFLADPELGLAGVYAMGDAEIYFEARRTLDPASGAPGPLSLRLVDADARTLALAGEPFAREWVPQKGEFASGDGLAYARMLSGLGDALAAAELHASLSSERAGLARLATQAAATPSSGFPLRTDAPARASAADVSQVAAFYQHTAKDVRVDRQRDGTVEANLGNGIVLQFSQHFVADEPDDLGRMGRFDAYSQVKAADGYVLTTELGGDLVPEGWSEAMEHENERDHHALASDFGRAATALNALAYSDLAQGGTAGQRSEQQAMQRLAQSLASHLLPVRDTAPSASPGKPPLGRMAGGRYQTYIQVWRKPFVVIAEHSGTRVGKWRYNSATSTVRTHQGWVSYCNHGTCAATQNMTHKCTFTGPRLTYYRTPARRADAGGHTCATPYWAIARGGHHNCHDDSSTQLRAVRGQAYGSTSYRCNDSVFWAYAPSCGAQ